MKFTGFLFVSLILMALHTSAQEVRPMATDRPGLGSDAPITVPKGYLQLEAGFQMDRDRTTTGTMEVDEIAWVYPTSLFRYGILDNWEFRVSFDLLTVESQLINRDLRSVERGVSPLNLGTKVSITEEQGWIPYMSVQLSLSIASTGSEDFRTRFTQPTIIWLMTKSITDKLDLTINLGSSWEDDLPAATYSYAASFDMSLQEKLGTFLEFYGFMPEAGPNMHLVNYGLTYLLNPALQLDVSSGVGLNREATDYFIGLGLSGRIDLL
ncbi:MAG: transporter [Cyclobacteriaceae bacterium]